MTYSQIITDAKRYLQALQEEMNDAPIAGVTYESLLGALDEFLQSDENVRKLENDAKAERAVRKQKFLLLLEKMRRTYLGFLAHPKFGEDAPVLSRLGKVRKSERKTGLTRKRREEPDPGGNEE
jgi:hypothetical protein